MRRSPRSGSDPEAKASASRARLRRSTSPRSPRSSRRCAPWGRGCSSATCPMACGVRSRSTPQWPTSRGATRDRRRRWDRARDDTDGRSQLRHQPLGEPGHRLGVRGRARYDVTTAGMMREHQRRSGAVGAIRTPSRWGDPTRPIPREGTVRGARRPTRPLRRQAGEACEPARNAPVAWADRSFQEACACRS